MPDESTGQRENDGEKSQQDRELIELLNELRVVLPGIQVMFAFLLVVPFSQGWVKTTDGQRSVFFAAFLLTTASTAFLIFPTSLHRFRWRARDKEHLLRVSNLAAIIGVGLLALGMSCVVHFVTSFVYDGSVAAWVAAAAAFLFIGLWFVYPILRAIQNPGPDG